MLGILLLLSVHKPQKTEWLSPSGWNFLELMWGSRNDSSRFLPLQSMKDTFSAHRRVDSSGNGGEFLTTHGLIVAKILQPPKTATLPGRLLTRTFQGGVVQAVGGSGEAGSRHFEGKEEGRGERTGVECLLAVRHGAALWFGSGFAATAPCGGSGRAPSVRVLGSRASAPAGPSLRVARPGAEPAGPRAAARGHCPREAPASRAPRSAPRARGHGTATCHRLFSVPPPFRFSLLPSAVGPDPETTRRVPSARCLPETLWLPQVLTGCRHQIFIPD